MTKKKNNNQHTQKRLHNKHYKTPISSLFDKPIRKGNLKKKTKLMTKKVVVDHI